MCSSDLDLDADGDNLVLEGTPAPDDDALGVSVRSNRVVLNLPATEGVRTVHYTVSDSRGGTDVGTLTVQVDANAPAASPVGADDYVTAMRCIFVLNSYIYDEMFL